MEGGLWTTVQKVRGEGYDDYTQEKRKEEGILGED